jgi:hypothetical protein
VGPATSLVRCHCVASTVQNAGYGYADPYSSHLRCDQNKVWKFYYCWSHGLVGLNHKHTSATCKNPFESHKSNAILAMVGNNRIRIKNTKPRRAKYVPCMSSSRHPRSRKQKGQGIRHPGSVKREKHRIFHRSIITGQG